MTFLDFIKYVLRISSKEISLINKYKFFYHKILKIIFAIKTTLKYEIESVIEYLPLFRCIMNGRDSSVGRAED